jgi:hypothetical protein
MKTVLKISLASLPFLVGCYSINQEPQPVIIVELTLKEKEVINNIVYETQKVLSTIDDLRNSKALSYVTKLKIPGWIVEHKEEKVLFFPRKVFVTYKYFKVPNSCVKTVESAELNVCHIKLRKTLTRLGQTFNCETKVEEIKGYPLQEKVEIRCSY